MNATSHIVPSDLWPPPDMDPAAVAEQILADLKANTRATPPKLLAAQLVAHHVRYGEALPAIAVRALAAAMSATDATPQEWNSVAEAVEAARRAAASPKKVTRKRRGEVQVLPAILDSPQRAVVFNVVRWMSEQGMALPDPVFHFIVVALGLTDGNDQLAQSYKEAVAPSYGGEAVVGVLIDGRFYGPKDVLPESGNDAQWVWGKLKSQPRHGIRHREAMWDKAVKIEAAARIERGTHAGTRALPYKELARKLEAAGFKEEHVDIDLLKRWGRSRPWKMAVLSAAVYPIWNAQKRAPRPADPTPPRRP